MLNRFLCQGNELWVVAVRGHNVIDHDKAVFSQLRFVRVITFTSSQTFEYTRLKWWYKPEILVERFDKVVADVKANPEKYGFDKDAVFNV